MKTCDVEGCQQRPRVKIFLDGALECGLCYSHAAACCDELDIQHPLRVKKPTREQRRLMRRQEQRERRICLERIAAIREGLGL